MLAIVLALPASAAAQATRTWVSGLGDDANPCSRTLPCKTWAGAITRTAVGGEIDALDSAGYGQLTITNSITLSGEGVNASILASSGPGLTVNAPAGATVIIHDLQINGINANTEVPPGTNGIVFSGAGRLRVEGGSIFAFANNGILDTASTSGSQLTVENEHIYSNTGDGVLLAPAGGVSAAAVLDGDYLDGNGCGIAVAAFGTGTGTCGTAAAGTAASGATATSANTSITNDSSVGVYSGGAPSENVISSDLITGNGTGLLTSGGGTIISLGPDNVVFANTTNGSPTSASGAAGPAGPAGPTGATGAAGATGPSGKIELVTCNTVTVFVKEKVKGKSHRVKRTKQKCTGKLVSGTVKFRTNRAVVKATLSRAGQVYATGTARMGKTGTESALELQRKLTRGRYTLTLSRGSTVLSRHTVLES